MNGDWLSRQNNLIGERSSEKLRSSRVLVAGLGGVGGAAFEALVRAGVGHILAADCDVFECSNLNRQLLCTRDTLEKSKAECARARALSVNPDADISVFCERIGADNLSALFEFAPDFIVDAVDSVTAKLALISESKRLSVPIISCMGTGNRLDAGGFAVGDIADTASCGCPLARVMRRELRARGISGVTVLYSKIPPIPTDDPKLVASISFVPPVAGYLMAGHVVRSLLAKK